MQTVAHGLKELGKLGQRRRTFGLGKKIDLAKNRNQFDAVYNIEENEFNGTVTLQLKLKDLQ